MSSVTVSLHYLPRCLCSKVPYRAPIQWFQINPGCTPKKTYAYDKNPERLCYEQKHMSVLIWIETIIEYWFNYSSSSKFSSAVQTLTFAEELVQFAALFKAILDKQKPNLDHTDGKCRDCECICVLWKTRYTLLFQILKFLRINLSSWFSTVLESCLFLCCIEALSSQFNWAKTKHAVSDEHGAWDSWR